MEIIKYFNEWAKAEIIASFYFMFIGLLYALGSFCLWKIGEAPLSRALIIPLLVSGILLLGAGVGFYVSNKTKLNNFEMDYKSDPEKVINAELERTSSTIKTYENVALKIFPIIIIITALIASFTSNVNVKAIGIAIIAFFLVLVLLDSQALKRMQIYNRQLNVMQVDLK